MLSKIQLYINYRINLLDVLSYVTLDFQRVSDDIINEYVFYFLFAVV
ncbi:MAG: hypothetical protein K8S62_04430 [Candidatus Sabulitectum sp.]|nr:hypothetical protein [Candidatus Sabulitectum sp.]